VTTWEGDTSTATPARLEPEPAHDPGARPGDATDVGADTRVGVELPQPARTAPVSAAPQIITGTAPTRRRV
jgi:hypothetical protein